ncbi:MAG: site-specific DNA-methyltransferase, partial [Phototrophicales bacterium]
MPNKLYYGDNFDILRNRDYFSDECVDLIYLDPPFNSNRDYNVLFSDESGFESEAQITAFKDTWHWGQPADDTYRDLIINGPEHVSTAMRAMYTLIGTNQMMAYLVMMAARLVELHRVLKPTGSLYLHCDPTASHYLKMVLDAAFRPENFLAEIIWKRTSAHSSARRPGPVHDVILMYVKSRDNYTWNQQYTPYDREYVENYYRHIEEDTDRRFTLSDLTGAGVRYGETGKEWRGIDITAKGRHWMYPPDELERLDKEGRIYWPEQGEMPRYKRYLDEMEGVPLQDVWDDIKPIGARAKERLGYPTQKPVTLLERIIEASSNPGDVVLDPFCGCGTAIVAAHKLDRDWIGIDITHLSVALMKYRLRDMFGLQAKKDYEVIGEPTTLAGAQQLAQDNRFQFQFWATSLVEAKPIGNGEAKKGKDRGIDGVINFFDGIGRNLQVQRVLIQVKSGKVGVRDIRDLVGTVEREEAAIGVFITLNKPTRGMVAEALSAGYYDSPAWGRQYRKIQILTIEELLKDASIDMPPQHGTFKQAERVK